MLGVEVWTQSSSNNIFYLPFEEIGLKISVLIANITNIRDRVEERLWL